MLAPAVLSSRRTSNSKEQFYRDGLIKTSKTIFHSSNILLATEIEEVMNGFSLLTVTTVQAVRQAVFKEPLPGKRVSGSNTFDHSWFLPRQNLVQCLSSLLPSKLSRRRYFRSHSTSRWSGAEFTEARPQWPPGTRKPTRTLPLIAIWHLNASLCFPPDNTWHPRELPEISKRTRSHESYP